MRFNKKLVFCYIQYNKLVLCILLTVLFKETFSQEQNLKFDHITTANSLPQNTVYGITKDKYGFIWINTWAGLARYDGIKMVSYKTKNEKKNSIIDNRLKCIIKDKNGDLWMSFFITEVLCRYNYDTDDFTRFTKNEAPKEIRDSLSRLYDSPILLVKNKDFKWFIKPWHFDEKTCLLTQENNHTGEKQTLTYDPLNPYSPSDRFNNIIYLDNQDILWLGTYGAGINKADTRAKKFQHYYHIEFNNNSLDDNYVRTICDEKNGNIWIGTHDKGITCLNRKENRYVHFKHSETEINSLISNSIRKLYFDHRGFLWIATKNGLDKYNLKTKTFRHFTAEKNQIPNNWVYAIVEDSSKRLWIGTFKGIARYDDIHDKFIAYDPQKIHIHRRARAIIADSKNKLWVGTEGGGVTIITLNGDSIESKNLNLSSSNLNLNRVYSIVEDKKKDIWIGTAGGLMKYSSSSGKIKKYIIKDSIQDETIVGLLIDKNGNLWISQKNGLSKFDFKQNLIKNYSSADGLQGNEFAEDAYYKSPYTGELFFGGTNGLNIFYPDSIKDNLFEPKVVFTELTVGNKVIKVGDTISGRVILRKPLYLMNEISIKHSDRIFSIEFVALHYSNPTSNKYRYKLEGFDKDWINTTSADRLATYSNLWPGTYILNVLASNNDGIWTKKPIKLKIIILPEWWQQRWFIILVIIALITALYFIYKLRIALYQKQQEELNRIVKSRTQELEEKNNLLLERQHQIELQSKELQQNAENLIKINSLLIEKQTFIQEQSKKLQEANEELSTLVSTKDRFFSIIAHDLRNPFNIVTGFSGLLLRNLEKYKPEKIRHFIEMINKTSHNTFLLLNNLLDWSRSQSGQIQYNPSNINLLILLEETLNFLNSQVAQKNIKIIPEVNSDIFVYADENMLKTIIRNLISNSIKFTHAGGTITIKSTEKNGMIEVEVIDTGVGIPPDKIEVLFRIDVDFHAKGTNNENGTGLGLILCKEFVEKNGGNIWVKSTEGQGSTFTFTLNCS